MFMVLIRGSKEKVIVMFLLRGMKKKTFLVLLWRDGPSPQSSNINGVDGTECLWFYLGGGEETFMMQPQGG